MVLLVDLQVLGEMVDPCGEQGHLDLRRTRVGLVEAVLGDRGGGIGHARYRTFLLADKERTSEGAYQRAGDDLRRGSRRVGPFVTRGSGASRRRRAPSAPPVRRRSRTSP